MTKLSPLAAAGGVLALVLIAKIGVAAPLSQGADATIKAAATLNMVEQTHGTHRTAGHLCRYFLVRSGAWSIGRPTLPTINCTPQDACSFWYGVTFVSRFSSVCIHTLCVIIIYRLPFFDASSPLLYHITYERILWIL